MVSMSRRVTVVVALGAALILVATSMADAAPRKKRKPAGYTKEYGFLPGYAEARAERLRADKWGTNPYWYGTSGFYRGQWNGGGFGPCWTRTPIGMAWNCGR